MAGRPTDVKSLLDTCAQARTGSGLDDVVTTPTLLFYFTAKGQGVVLFDVPRGPSTAYLLSDDLADARAQNRALRLPTDLKRELAKLSGPVHAYWADPVHDLDETQARLFAFSGQDLFAIRIVHKDTAAPGLPKKIAMD